MFFDDLKLSKLLLDFISIRNVGIDSEIIQ